MTSDLPPIQKDTPVLKRKKRAKPVHFSEIMTTMTPSETSNEMQRQGSFNNMDTESPSLVALPCSPTAQAFFAALDNQTTGTTTTKKSSALIRKRIQTLGWRNRYSQSEYYPIDLTLSKQKSTETDDEYITGNVTDETRIQFSVRQHQRGELEGTFGTGATVWPASLVLIKYMEKHAAKLIQNKRIVDLGSGTGVTSLAAAYLGAQQVICTDGEPAVVQLALENVKQQIKRQEQQLKMSCEIKETVSNEKDPLMELNGCVIHVQQYWWGSGTIHFDSDLDGKPDPDNIVVLVSDCVLPKLYPIAPLVDALDELLPRFPETINCSAILSYEHRYFPDYDPRDKFRELCQVKGLQVTVIPLEEQDPVYSVEDIEIWQVVRRE